MADVFLMRVHVFAKLAVVRQGGRTNITLQPGLLRLHNSLWAGLLRLHNSLWAGQLRFDYHRLPLLPRLFRHSEGQTMLFHSKTIFYNIIMGTVPINKLCEQRF